MVVPIVLLYKKMVLHSFVIKYVFAAAAASALSAPFLKKCNAMNLGIRWAVKDPPKSEEKGKEGCISRLHLKEPSKWDRLGAAL